MTVKELKNVISKLDDDVTVVFVMSPDDNILNDCSDISHAIYSEQLVKDGRKQICFMPF